MSVLVLTDNASYIQALKQLIQASEVHRQLIMGFTELLVNASHYERLDLLWDGLREIIMELETHAEKQGTIH